MLLTILVVLAATPPQLAAPGLQCSGVEPALCDAYLEHFVANVTARGVKVTTKNDVAQVIGVERQRELLGCSSAGTSCLAELAGALGVAQVLTGSVAKSESGFVSTLKVIDSTDGSTKWSATKRVDSERALFAFFEEEASSLVVTLSPALGGPPTIVKWIPALVGAAAVSVGAMLLGASVGQAQILRDQIANPEPLSKVLLAPDYTVEDELLLAADEGRALQVAGWSCIGGGLVAAASSVLWVLLSSSPSSGSAFLAPTRGGAVAGFGLVWP